MENITKEGWIFLYVTMSLLILLAVALIVISCVPLNLKKELRAKMKTPVRWITLVTVIALALAFVASVPWWVTAITIIVAAVIILGACVSGFVSLLNALCDY